MIDLLQFEFMRNALYAALLCSALCGILGTLVVVRKYVILAGGVAHAAYGGVGLALYAGVSPRLGAIAFSLLLAFPMAWVMLKKAARADAIIGVLWAAGMAVGIIFADLTPGYGSDLMSYLFGSILTVTGEDLLLMAGLLGTSLLAGAIWHRQIAAFSYDEEFARTRGVPVTFLHFLLVILISLAVVVIIRIVGLILVIALLTIPPSVAEKYSSSLWGMMAISCALSAVFTVSGLALAVRWNLTAGAVIILVASMVYILSMVLPFGKKK
ncbi:metal ABC transporter permease [Aminivibrio sp.]